VLLASIILLSQVAVVVELNTAVAVGRVDLELVQVYLSPQELLTP
jgi:hypothetical protein